jgi:hypothetical protein
MAPPPVLSSAPQGLAACVTTGRPTLVLRYLDKARPSTARGA